MVWAAGDLGFRFQRVQHLVESLACAECGGPPGGRCRAFRPAWGPWPYQHAGVRTFGVAVIAPAGAPHHGHVAVVPGGRSSNRAAFRDNAVSAGGIHRRWDSRSASSHRFDARPDTRPNVRATDRSATFQPPMSRQRDERGPPLDRNQRFGDSQRPQLDAPRWVRPEDRVSPQGQAPARPDAGSPPTATRPHGGVPARTPGTADVPRSPGMWGGNRGPAESRHVSSTAPAASRAISTIRGDGPVATMSHHRWRRITGSSIPRGAQQEPRGSAPEFRARGPEVTREFRAASRHQDAQRDWTAASPDARLLGRV